jgi:hypothetical protein
VRRRDDPSAVPLYEDLIRRALAARERSQALQRSSLQVASLAQLLRDARAGRVMLVHCAWCNAFRIGDEWLQLEAVGQGQVQIAHALREKASHGICPRCFEAEVERSELQREHDA